MPKYFSFFAIIICLFLYSCKKDVLHLQKVQQLNSNTTCQLNSITFIGSNICIAAGGVKYDQSVVLRSADGGFTWVANSYSTAPKAMYGMGLSPNGNIFLSGVDGDVLHSKDSGKTWQFNRALDWLFHVGISFPTPDTGFLISTVLQRQSTITRVDSNFNIIDEQTFLFGLNNIYMTGPATGYVIGYGAVMKTTDEGNTWNFQKVDGDNFMGMDIHSSKMWMCGYSGSVFYTDNSGNTWTKLRNGNDLAQVQYRMLCIVFKDDMNGWIGCDDGTLLYSDDGGNHWAQYDKFTSNPIRSMAICPNGDLLTVGDNGSIFRVTP